MSSKRIRADQLLVEQGLTQSRERAKRLIMAGQIHLVDDTGARERVDKPGQQLPPEARLEVSAVQRYVSRGGEKLETALEHFDLEVTGLTCLDVGASTGGFTDCLLQHGARAVHA
ncbi:MAG: SAM-dependent methyltransferase, partial [Desulfohalobiaceae bacterium]